MELPELVAIVVAVFFGIVAIVFSLKEETYKKLVKTSKNSFDEINKLLGILPTEQKQSLNVNHLVTTIAQSIATAFPKSTVTSLVIDKQSLSLRLHSLEKIGNIYLKHIETSMIQSLVTLTDTQLPHLIQKHIQEEQLTNTSLIPQSFFHIPIILQDTVHGVITVSTTTPHAYKEEEVTKAYKASHHITNTIGTVHGLVQSGQSTLLALIQSMHVGVCLLDKNFEILILNDAARIMLKTHKKYPTFTQLHNAFPQDYPLKEKIFDVVTHQIQIDEKELKINKKGAVAVSIIPVTTQSPSEQKELIGVLLTLRDISAEKTTTQMREDFTHMIIHEMRAPLTTMKNAAELLIESDTTLEKKQKEQLLTVIAEQSKKLLEEVGSILDAAKMEHGMFNADKRPGNMKQIIEKAKELFSPQAQTKHIALKTIIDPDLPSLYFDPLRIGEVMNNLISNSLKFTPAGGTVTITAGQDKDHNNLVVAVSDNGIGIPKDKQQYLFAKFTQVNPSYAKLETQPEGTGLGLYITKGIVESHGGSISLVSDIGKGTTITFTLPLS